MGQRHAARRLAALAWAFCWIVAAPLTAALGGEVALESTGPALGGLISAVPPADTLSEVLSESTAGGVVAAGPFVELRIDCPADATITINGRPTQSGGDFRVLRTMPLPNKRPIRLVVHGTRQVCDPFTGQPHEQAVDCPVWARRGEVRYLRWEAKEPRMHPMFGQEMAHHCEVTDSAAAACDTWVFADVDRPHESAELVDEAAAKQSERELAMSQFEKAVDQFVAASATRAIQNGPFAWGDHPEFFALVKYKGDDSVESIRPRVEDAVDFLVLRDQVGAPGDPRSALQAKCQMLVSVYALIPDPSSTDPKSPKMIERDLKLEMAPLPLDLSLKPDWTTKVPFAATAAAAAGADAGGAAPSKPLADLVCERLQTMPRTVGAGLAGSYKASKLIVRAKLDFGHTVVDVDGDIVLNLLPAP